MLIEHFIEPRALAELSKSRRNCRDFIKEFSKPSPRVISAFPKFKNLRKLARIAQSSTASDIEVDRLIELLKFIQDCHLVDRVGLYNGDIDPLENFKNEASHFFNGIHLISDEVNPTHLEHPFISIRQFEQGIEALEHQVGMPKVIEDFCLTLGEFLRLSKTITIVDPYFSTQPGVWNVFLALMETAISKSPVVGKTVKVLFDSEKNKNARSCMYLKEKLYKLAPSWITQFDSIVFCNVRENGREATHNRYIITELGAVSLPYGLQETNKNELDDVTLLSSNLYQTRYNQYCDMQGVELVEQMQL